MATVKRHGPERERRGDQDGPIPATYEIDWKDPDKIDKWDLIQFVVGQYRLGKERRQGWERGAAEQLAWARGNQSLVWDRFKRDLRERQDNEIPLELREPVHLNLLRGYIMQYLGLNVGQPMKWVVNSATRDSDDIEAAKLQQQIINYYWQVGSEHMGVRLLKALWMMFCTGIVWFKPTWDPQAGETDRFTEKVLRAPGMNAESDKQRKGMLATFKKYVKTKSKGRVDVDEDGGLELPAGDFYFDWASGFDITEPLNCQGVDEAAWLIHSRYRSIEYVRERYPKTSKNVLPDVDSEQYEWRRYSQYGTPDDPEGRSAASTPSDEVMVHEIWRPRSASAPLGFMGVVCDNFVLLSGPHPYLHGRLPFVPCTEIPEPEHFRPGCSIRDLMPQQRALNTQRSLMTGHIKATVDPRYLVEKTAGLPEDAFTSGPKRILVNDGGIERVKRLEMGPIGSDVHRLDQLTRDGMDDVAGIHANTRGKSESAQQSGRHAEAMQRNDARPQGITRQLISGALSEACNQSLWLFWEFVTGDRLTPILGDNGARDLVSWRGSDLVARKEQPVGPHKFNAHCSLGVERTPEDTMRYIEGLTKAGYLTAEREEDRLLVKRMIGEMVPDEMDDSAAHRGNAFAENRLMMTKLEPQRVAIGDDHALHLEAHLRATTTGEYKEYTGKDPIIHLLMEQHLEQHYIYQAERVLRPMAAGQVAKVRLMKEYGLPPEQQQQGGGPARPGAGGPSRVLPGPASGGSPRPGPTPVPAGAGRMN